MDSLPEESGVTCRMHDLRHSFVSALAQAQVADSTLMALTGHMSKRMLEHYSHVRNEAKRAAVSSLDAVISPLSPGQPPTKSPTAGADRGAAIDVTC